MPIIAARGGLTRRRKVSDNNPSVFTQNYTNRTPICAKFQTMLAVNRKQQKKERAHREPARHPSNKLHTLETQLTVAANRPCHHSNYGHTPPATTLISESTSP
jgi:hypothetical protein